MATIRLTEARIRDVKPQASTRIYWDHAVKGLGLRVTPAGSKAYVLQYRVAGRSRRSTLSQASAIPLRRAREIAGEQLLAIRGGADPLQARQDEKMAPTVADGLDRYFGTYAPRRVLDGLMKESTLRGYRAQAKAVIRPALGSLKIADVTRGDVEKMLERVKGPVSRNRIQALTSRLFNIFEQWGLRPPHANPVSSIEKVRERARTRIISASELAALGAAFDDIKCVAHRTALRVLFLTGWRVSEILSLRWDRIDLATGVVFLADTKVGPSRRTMDALALQVLADLPRAGPRVFAGTSYGALRERFLSACRAAGVVDARLHDARRTVATTAAAAGLSAFVLRDLLGHSTLTMSNRYVQETGGAVQQAQAAAAQRMTAMMSGADADIENLDEHRHAAGSTSR